MDTLLQLEHQGWEALATAGDAGKDFYRAMLTDDAVMVFPGGMLVEGKVHILQSIGPQPWTSFHLDRLRVLPLSDDAAMVVYQVTAQRAGSPPYTALVSSAYAQRAGVEGTSSQGVRSNDVRRARDVGLQKTHLQHLATAAAINVLRVSDWLDERPRAQTRQSQFERLYRMAA